MALTGAVIDGEADICLVSSFDLGGVPKLDTGVVDVRISFALVVFSPLNVCGVVGVSFKNELLILSLVREISLLVFCCV